MPTDSTETLHQRYRREAEIKRLRAALKKANDQSEHFEREWYLRCDEIEHLRAELETERMRLAACGVVALANTPDSATKARDMLPEYRSASCDDVARMVDENMRLRAELDALCRNNSYCPMCGNGTVPSVPDVDQILTLVLEVCNDWVSHGMPTTGAINAAFLDSTGDRDKYPKPLDALVKLVAAALKPEER